MGHIERRAQIYAALYWERVVSPQVRAQMMCAAGEALCDASQLALPTSDSLARQGGDSDRTRAAPHRPPSRNMPSNALCGTAAVGAPHFGCSSVLREHLCTIRSACLVNSSENTQNTAPTSEQRSRARVSRRLLCSPRDGLCRITFNKPTTSVTRHQLDTRDSVHSRQELRKQGTAGTRPEGLPPAPTCPDYTG